MSEFVIRQVDPAAEREKILAVLSANLPAAAGAARFAWLYLENPDGPALVWLAENERGEAMATSAAHPRRMRVGGETVRALVLGDFAVDRSQRSLGLALRLLRATLAPVRAGAYAFSLDYCNAPMRAVYRRMDAAPLAAAERWMLPVAVARLLRGRLGNGVLTELLGRAGDAALRARRSLRGGVVGVCVERLGAGTASEIAGPDARLSPRAFAAAVRDGAFLSWHYADNPLWRHEILGARAGGALVGYAVLRFAAAAAVSVVDLQAPDRRVGRALLSAAHDRARSCGAAALHVEVLAASPSAQLFRALGFFRRETGAGPVVVLSPDCPHATKLQHPQSWWLMGGDRDV